MRASACDELGWELGEFRVVNTDLTLLERAEDEVQVLRAVSGAGGWQRKGRVGI